MPNAESKLSAPALTSFCPPTILNAILAHCRLKAPAEACGAWSTDANGLWCHHPIPNRLSSPDNHIAFQMDPLLWLSLLEDERSNLRTIHGLYHSHPTSPPTLSKRDVESMTLGQRPTYPNYLQMIIGYPTSTNPQVSLYTWNTTYNRYHALTEEIMS